MADLKTRPTGKSVSRFVGALSDSKRRADCRALQSIMRAVTGNRARMWGPSIVGYGVYEYTNTPGHAEWPLTGFAPRGRELTIYVMPGFERYAGLMKKLGRHRTGRSCLYLRRLDDVDRDVLADLLRRSVADMRRMYVTR